MKTAAEESPISLTRPIEGLPRNLITGRDLPAERASARSKGKFILQADISNFYGSIYTHTIPWALHGKAEARAALSGKPSEELLGDTLDKLCRAMQDGQSVGLPVGPDASLLLAEVILSKVDNSVLAACAGKGFRFIDDYELVFDSELRAIEIRTALQSALAEFRLTLNPLKTGIRRLPVGLDDDSVVREHAPQRHSSEVAWALWACLGFKLKLSDVAAQAVMQMEDSVCSLLLYQAHLNGLLEPGNNFEEWKTSIGPDDLRGHRWLLAYELTRLRFTLDATGANYVTRDPMFGFLLKEGVGFFDGSRVGVVPPGLLPIEDGDEGDEDEDEEDETDDYSEGGFWDEWDWDDDDDEPEEEQKEDPTKKRSHAKHLRELIAGMKRTTLAPPPAPPNAPPPAPATPDEEKP